MATKIKNKNKTELFKFLQEAFFVKPAKEGRYELKADGEGAVEVTWTVSGVYEPRQLSAALQKRLKNALPLPLERMILGTEKVRFLAEDGFYAVRSENCAFELSPAFDIFDKADREIIAVLAARCLDYALIRAELAAFRGVGEEEIKYRFIPKNTLALRIFINSTNLYLGDIDVSGLDDLTYAFSIYSNNRVEENPRTDFQGIETWDTSKVKTMLGVFAGCVNFNSDISAWDTSKVTNTEVMFASCRKFNQPLSGMDVSQVETMKGMFYRCDAFDQDLSAWNTARVRDMSYMFFKCGRYAHDLSSWDTAALKNDENMFLECPLADDRKPNSPSTDFKRQYYEKYIGPNAKKYARDANLKKLAVAAAFVALVVAFALFNQGLGS